MATQILGVLDNGQDKRLSQAEVTALLDPSLTSIAGLAGTSGFLKKSGAGTYVLDTTSYVTSVGLSLPSIFSVTGSPVTGSGTLSATLASQTANLIFASPNGSAGAPTFRALAAADVPDISASYVTIGTTQSISGVKTFSGGIVLNGNLTGTGASASAGANTVVLRNSSGYIFNNYFNMTANDTTATVSRMAIETGSYGYLRWQSPAQFITNHSLAVQGNNNVTFRDVTVNRGDGTGALFFGASGSRYLYYNGTYILPTDNLMVGGDVQAYASDRRLKKNIVDAPRNRIDEFFDKVNIREFDWDSDAINKYGVGIKPKTKQIGAIAQELREACPDAVDINHAHNPISTKDDPNPPKHDILTIMWDKTVPYVIAKTKQHIDELDDLRSVVINQRRQLDDLKEVIMILAKRIGK